MKKGELTHIDSNGMPTMVDVGEKVVTDRRAIARATVKLPAEHGIFVDSAFETKKGPVIHTAVIAGTLAAKRTSEFIPFCHSLNLSSIKFAVRLLSPSSLELDCEVRTAGQTGVEMEALTGVSIAALTVYDMCKALTHEISIGPIELVMKSGGRRGYVARKY